VAAAAELFRSVREAANNDRASASGAPDEVLC
jgi:hypothetical protein